MLARTDAHTLTDTLTDTLTFNLIKQVQQRAIRLVPETKGLPYYNRLKELQLPTLTTKAENRHNADFLNCQRKILGQPGLQMFTVSIKADVPKSHWYHKRT